MAATTVELKSIPKEAFAGCFQQWRHRWSKCVESQGDYFEGDQVSNTTGTLCLFFPGQRSDTFLTDLVFSGEIFFDKCRGTFGTPRIKHLKNNTKQKCEKCLVFRYRIFHLFICNDNNFNLKPILLKLQLYYSNFMSTLSGY